jgi:hypothetical protein
MATRGGPTLRRRELAMRLRDLRATSERNIEDVAAEMLCSPTKISRIETAQRAASPRDVRDLCRIYGTTDDVRDELMRLARESRQRGWWQEFTDVPPHYATYVGLETDAISMRNYESVVIPGLLQTEDYATAVVRGGAISPPAAYVAERVDVRLRRQERLGGTNPLDFWAILDESALRRLIGGPIVMAAQLHHLIDTIERPNITFQVVPRSVGSYAGMEASSFVVLSFAGQLDDVVYIEGIVGSIFVERDSEVRRIDGLFDRLRAVALSPADSRELVRQIAEDLDNRL